MKPTTFIIGVIVAALFMTVFGLVLANVNTKYNIVPQGYNSTELEVFNKLNEMQNISEEMQERVQNQTVDKSLADVIGGLYADGKDTLLISSKSYDVITDMSDAGLKKANVPSAFKTALFTILIVIVFIGIVLSAVLGRDL